MTNLVPEGPFGLPYEARVDAGIYDVAGRRVRALERGVLLPAGEHTLAWDGTGERRGAVGAGIYFVRVQAGSRAIVKRIVLLVVS